MSYTLQQLQILLRQAGWPDVTINTVDGPAPLIPLMASFALAESSGNPGAHNPAGEDSWGLLQINRKAHPQYSVAQLTDPLTNLQLALEIYNREGTRAWGVGPDWDGSYLSRGRYNDSLAIYQQGTQTQDGNTSAPTTPSTGTNGLALVIAAVLGYIVAREFGLV